MPLNIRVDERILEKAPQRLLLLSVIAMSEAKYRFKLNPATVIITSGLNPDLNLNLHCKSKDDDLGSHVIPHGTEYKFGFQPHFFGVTQFWCGFSWKNSGQERMFDIYIQNRDYPLCDVCKWVIQDKGPCMFLPKTPKPYNCTVCYPWNP
ncbi:S-protein homolog 5-like [Mercurialis annua]|uniref:S-protein homolog 5-like n=1 Tax=Mercurialis annua TaxID=3986 RepID=UPI0024ADE86B|nr:S-protein homolog 5-like [Mercurialis annua]